jgi:hypothetical protein
MNNPKTDPWQQVVRSLRGLGKMDADPLDPKWVLCYTDGTRNIALEHSHGTLDEILQAFEDFCKGCGFVFDGFAIVDEDGIPVHGLNSIAKLEAGDEDQTSQ